MTLTNDDIRRIVDVVCARKKTLKEVAEKHDITPARVSQLITEFKRPHKYPIIHKRGAKRSPLSKQHHDLVISVKKMFNIGSAAVAAYIRTKYWIPIGTMTVHKILLKEGLTTEDSRKSFR